MLRIQNLSAVLRGVLMGAVTALAAAVLVVVPSALNPAQSASALDWPEYSIDISKFNASKIIADEIFFDGNAMNASQIQTFLNEKVTSCRSGYTCLKSYTESTPAIAGNPMCSAVAGGTNETAAVIIQKYAQACGISPKVILVTLQKEQGLVTDTWPITRQYTYAMGADCPDSGDGCGLTAGFAKQVYRGAYMMKRYTGPAGTGPGTYYDYPFVNMKKVGTWQNIQYGVDPACGTKSVYISNQATHVLYVYTPYTPNDAALAAGWGTASCGAYGNRNFFRYFFQWFGDPNGIAPTLTAAPSLSGDSRVGGTINANPGSWTLNPAGSITYQFLSCPAGSGASRTAPAGCTDASAPGAAQSMLVTSAMAGRFLVAKVTVTNTVGSGVAYSASSAQVGQNNDIPVISSGSPTVAAAVSTTAGNWTAARVAFNFQMGGAKYRGYPILAIQQALNLSGIGTDVNGVYGAQTIANVKTFQRNYGLTSDGIVGAATWAKMMLQTGPGTPTYAYRWLACSSPVVAVQGGVPATCSYIGGANGNSYTPVAADQGKYLVSEVTASTVADAAKTRWSLSTTSPVGASLVAAVPAPAAPAPAPAPASTPNLPVTVDNPVLPKITGTLAVGSPLSTTTGPWTAARVAFSFQMAGSRYNGYPILAIQQALNLSGIPTNVNGAYGAQTIANVKTFQRNYGLSADGMVGAKTWAKMMLQTVLGTPTFTYRWLRCTAVVTTAVTAAPAFCVYIDGAAANTYTVTAADRGKYLVSEVTASTVTDAAKTRWSYSTVVVP